MKNMLQQYFPMIRTKEELMSEIKKRSILSREFYSWKQEARKEFVDFCTGAKGVKMMYDFISKEILNPEVVPERVDELLSLLLGQEVHVKDVLPNDGTRIADESALVIMDIVVELQDKSIVNLEVQKIGYKFPGARSACYSADLLMRQYKKVRSKRKKKFNYNDIKDVYTIVLFEQSPGAFHEFPDDYLHQFHQCSNTGLKLNLLQKYLFVPLDIFLDSLQYKDIKIQNRLDAWLAFLGSDDPEIIIDIIEQYPDFKEMYQQVYDICRNIEEVMGMFSKELLEMDRNTVELMIDEMQDEIKQQKEVIEEKDTTIQKNEAALKEKDEALQQKDSELQEMQQKMKELQEEALRIKQLLRLTSGKLNLKDFLQCPKFFR